MKDINTALAAIWPTILGTNLLFSVLTKQKEERFQSCFRQLQFYFLDPLDMPATRSPGTSPLHIELYQQHLFVSSPLCTYTIATADYVSLCIVASFNSKKTQV